MLRPMWKRFLYRLLPTPVRIQGLSTYSKNFVLDMRDMLSGNRDSTTPPRRLNVSGEGSFHDLGLHNDSLCRTFGHLKADDRVFDLGCGIGRLAIAMESFIEPPGSYVGLDIIRFAISWCQNHISSRNPNFRFVHADIFNFMYNGQGKIAPDRFSFPFPTESFSFCLATSLFTHLLPAAVDQYLREVARVMTPGGSFLTTWFLLCDETISSMEAGMSQLNFPYKFVHHAQRSEHAPEQAVAFELDYLRGLYAAAGLAIDGVHFGGWSGYPGSIDSGQDLLIATGH